MRERASEGVCVRERQCVCVCVCVCERERDHERERERSRARECERGRSRERERGACQAGGAPFSGGRRTALLPRRSGRGASASTGLELLRGGGELVKGQVPLVWRGESRLRRRRVRLLIKITMKHTAPFNINHLCAIVWVGSVRSQSHAEAKPAKFTLTTAHHNTTGQIESGLALDHAGKQPPPSTATGGLK